jgi:hypothetical protein
MLSGCGSSTAKYVAGRDRTEATSAWHGKWGFSPRFGEKYRVDGGRVEGLVWYRLIDRDLAWRHCFHLVSWCEILRW